MGVVAEGASELWGIVGGTCALSGGSSAVCSEGPITVAPLGHGRAGLPHTRVSGEVTQESGGGATGRGAEGPRRPGQARPRHSELAARRYAHRKLGADVGQRLGSGPTWSSHSGVPLGPRGPAPRDAPPVSVSSQSAGLGQVGVIDPWISN